MRPSSAIETTTQNLLVLADILLFRTSLSFSLLAKIGERWPWQKLGPSKLPPRPVLSV